MPILHVDSASLNSAQITGSLFGTASYALNAGTAGSGTTFTAGNVDNRIITATGTTPELNGEVSLSFDGSTLQLSGSLIVSIGSAVELRVTASGVSIGNALTDIHPVTGSLRVNGSITGSLLGTASFADIARTAVTASTVNTVRATDNKSYFLTFVDSNNSAESNEAVYTQANLTYNPSTLVFSANTISSSFTGSLFGTASLASTSSAIITQRTASNQTYYLTFVDSANGGTGAPENLLTADGDVANITCNPLISRISALQFTGSLFGSASFAVSSSRAVTASIASTASYVNLLAGSNITINYQSNGIAITGSGGSGSPGGSNTAIQFNSGSTFSGSANLTYDYRTTGASPGRVSHLSDIDYGSASPGATTGSGAFLIKNNMGLTDRQQFVNMFHTQWRLTSGGGDQKIMKFDANGSNSPYGDLRMYGFKCDYSLVVRNTTNLENTVSRTGTLWAAWTHDTANAPVLDERVANGDTLYNELASAYFILSWNSADIQLDLNVDSVSSAGDEVYFSGLFTTFGTSL